jgi:hypothetical protein
LGVGVTSEATKDFAVAVTTGLVVGVVRDLIRGVRGDLVVVVVVVVIGVVFAGIRVDFDAVIAGLETDGVRPGLFGVVDVVVVVVVVTGATIELRSLFLISLISGVDDS